MDRGVSGVSLDTEVVRAFAGTPFDGLDAHAVLRPKDIAQRLRVRPRSARRASARGELPASRACGIRVLAADAAAWWRSRAALTAAMSSVDASYAIEHEHAYNQDAASPVDVERFREQQGALPGFAAGT